MTDIEPVSTSELEVFLGDSMVPAINASEVPAASAHDAIAPSGAWLAALRALGEATPALQEVIASAAQSGSALKVAFSPEVVSGLRNGTLHLVQSSKGALPTAANASGKFVEQAAVVGTGAAASSAAGITLGAAAAIALPVVIAGAAAYAQQRQLERALASIQAVVERIEARLEDTDTGVCDAADEFLLLAHEASQRGGLTPYLTIELATQRAAVDALYFSRKRWVDRFKATLAEQQTSHERRKGEVQPWVDIVEDEAKDGRLEKELTLFVRSLLNRTKLNVLAATVLVGEGQGEVAMQLISRSERELRSSFFDLHNRLRPLARTAPEPSVLQRLPKLGGALQQAHRTVKELVERLDADVLPVIPDPDDQREVELVLAPQTVAELQAAFETGAKSRRPDDSVSVGTDESGWNHGESAGAWGSRSR